MPNAPDLLAEAKRRLQPTLTTEQIDSWLAGVELNGGQLVLTYDGSSVYAEYPRHPATHAGA